jgi:hypothetical protein
MKRFLLNLYRKIGSPFIRTISEDFASVNEIRNANGGLAMLLQDCILFTVDALKYNIRREAPDNIALSGYKVYSQSDEDGIIQAIFEKILISPDGGTFVEIGCGDGLQNNTHALLLSGWRGAWIDGSASNINSVKEHLADHKNLIVEQQFVTRDNVFSLVSRLMTTLDTITLDFFSLDIDGNDYYVLESLLPHIKPRVICAEYNAKFPYPMRVKMEYDERHVWQMDDYFGASLGSLTELLDRHGYTLVTCNLSGVNAFFVNKIETSKLTIYPPEILYQPARYYLQHMPNGHPASLKFLAAVLKISSRAGSQR